MTIRQRIWFALGIVAIAIVWSPMLIMMVQLWTNRQ